MSIMNNLDLYFSLKVVRINTYKLSKYRVFRRMRYLSNESRCKREIGINDKNRDSKQLKNAFFFTGWYLEKQSCRNKCFKEQHSTLLTFHPLTENYYLRSYNGLNFLIKWKKVRIKDNYSYCWSKVITRRNRIRLRLQTWIKNMRDIRSINLCRNEWKTVSKSVSRSWETAWKSRRERKRKGRKYFSLLIDWSSFNW